MKTWTYEDITNITRYEINHMMKLCHKRGKKRFRRMAIGNFHSWAQLTRDLTNDPTREMDYQRFSKLIWGDAVTD